MPDASHAAPGPRLEFWLAAGVFALFYSAVIALLEPLADVPFIDDWTYAWSVERLLTTGHLEVLDWSAHYPFAQVLWGALFCLPFGFSFTALRTSTVVLAWLGALAFYGSLREVRCGVGSSLVATLLLLVNPVFFVLTFSFMTDVPFLSLSNGACFFYLRGLRRQGVTDFWIGGVLALAAFFTRQPGLMIFVAVGIVLLLGANRRQLTWSRVVALAVPFLVAVGALIALRQGPGVTSAYASKLAPLQYWTFVTPTKYLSFALRILSHVGLALTPLSVPLFLTLWHRRSLWWIIGIVFCLTGWCYLSDETLPLPFESGATWTLEELGAARLLLAPKNSVGDPWVPSWLVYPLAILGLGSGAVVIWEGAALLRRGPNIAQHREVLFSSLVVCHAGLIMLMWLFYDRYYLVLLPGFIALLVLSPHRRARAWDAELVGVGCLAVISFTGTWDNLGFTRLCAAALDALRDRGIARVAIDAGYPLNGWDIYAHPEILPPGSTARTDVPLVTSEAEPQYVIGVRPLRGYQVRRTIPVPSLWAAPTTLVIQEREP